MKRMKRLLPLLICIALALTAVSCRKRTDVGKGESYIYFLNGDRTGLQKVSYEIEEKDPVQAAEAMLEEMKQPVEEIEYTPPLQKGVEAESCTLEGEVLYVDFNEKYKQMPPIEETLVRAAVVQSLVKIEGITGVWLRVGGEDLTDENGMVLGYLTEYDFVRNSGSSPSSYQEETLELYFANELGDALVRQSVNVKYNSNIPKEKLIVEMLMKGPKKSGAYPTLNPDASLLSVTIKDGICYVNFDKTFLKSVYDVKPQVTIYSLVNSLVEGTEATMVQISVNGEANAKYMETVDLTQPLLEDTSWIEQKGDE